MDVVTPARFDVYLVSLDPTVGSEIRKTRPCVIVSPDEANNHLRTVVVAPMTSAPRPYPSRMSLQFQGREGQIAIDQIRAIDKARLKRRVGSIAGEDARRLTATLAEFFA